MVNTYSLMAIIFTGFIGPAVIYAQTVDKNCNFARHCASRQTVNDPSDGAGGKLARPAITMSDRNAVRSPPYVYAPFPSANGQPLTAIDYTFAPEGVVGSVGYIHIMDDHPIAPEAGLAASLGFSRPDSLVGAGLYYEFR